MLALAKKRGATAESPASGPFSRQRRWPPPSGAPAAPAPPSRNTVSTGRKHVEHRLLADIGPSARLDRLDRSGKSISDLLAGHVILQRLAE